MAGDVALLLRRAGFGPTAAEIAAARQVGYAPTLATLLTPPGPDIGATQAPIPAFGPDPYVGVRAQDQRARAQADERRRSQASALGRWWLDRMTVSSHEAVEKLVFFWHGHWATSITKVKSAQLMLRHHRTIRDNAGDVARLAHRMVVDPALVYWLDGHLNTRQAPNENLARELFELFLLGIGRYDEADVKRAAQALTGWQIDLAEERSVFVPSRHRTGVKTVLGVTGRLGADELVDLLLRDRACPRFIASRLWFRYASSARPIPEDVRERMVEAFPNTLAMLRTLFEAEAFQATAGTMVKQPVEWLVGAMRQLRVRPRLATTETMTQILDGLSGLGQRPFAPPSVGGWPSGAAWLTSAAAHVRLRLAAKLARLLVPDPLTPEDVAHILGIDRWTDRTYAVLRGVTNARLLLTLGMVSPEYLVT